LAARLRPDPLRSLSAPPDSLALARRRCRNEEGKGGGKKGKKKKGKGSCAPTKFFMSISPVRSFSPQFA